MSDAGPLDQLRHELGGEPSDGLKQLDAAQQRELAELIRGARHRQREALEQAIDNGLGFVPRLARGAVKKALFG